ncbi:hypothetical protein [Mycetocola sp.]|uniref:hypothetical protein n=1 Tax=Mycetocola sp. TaxID=1871042 RepID=UPI0039899531
MNVQFRDITGADRGFNVGADVLTQTADGVNLNRLWDEFNSALDLSNQQRNLISRLFTFDTTLSADTVALDTDGWEFEKASEFGQPQAGRVSPKGQLIGFPLDWFDAATRFTRKFVRNATAEQVTAQHRAALEADNRLLFRNTLSALTAPTTVASREVNENGVPIYSLYSGETDDIPPTFAGRSFAPGHTHYLVSGAATIDGGDLKTVTEHIQHHGHGLPSNGERVIIMVHPNQGEVIRGFRRDPADAAKPFDFIPSVTAPAYLTEENIVGDQAPAQFNGIPIIGSYGDAWIFESYYIPDGYALAVGTAGPNSSRNPLAFRQHPVSESQGMRLIPGNPSYPLIESIYERGFGVGVRNRGAAAVIQIKAIGSYVAPTWP